MMNTKGVFNVEIQLEDSTFSVNQINFFIRYCAKLTNVQLFWQLEYQASYFRVSMAST